VWKKMMGLGWERIRRWDWLNDECFVEIILLVGLFPDSRLRGNNDGGCIIDDFCYFVRRRFFFGG